MVARVLWEDLVRVRVSTPRLRASYNGITRLFQSRDRGSTPLVRSTTQKAPFVALFVLWSIYLGTLELILIVRFFIQPPANL